MINELFSLESCVRFFNFMAITNNEFHFHFFSIGFNPINNGSDEVTMKKELNQRVLAAENNE